MSSNEKKMKYRVDIVNTCIATGLPLTVRSTAVQIFDRAIGKIIPKDEEMINILYAIIILAAKCEEIHGDLNALIRKLPDSNKQKIFDYEDEILQVLGYNLHFPSLYLRIYGILTILQEKGIIEVTNAHIDLNVSIDGKSNEIYTFHNNKWIVPCINNLWLTSVQMMDKILLHEKTGYKEIEMVYASLPFPCEAFTLLSFPFDAKNVTELRNACVKIPFSLYNPENISM
ncbi:hypothetical protein OCOL_000445 [Ordospora colligata]|uniref:Cyclin N-terminal domain-containing protein n=1 Tax=Ordospora colligata OC4 TaxID=1354746 RepID=A0A0B2UID1_9MICR|nr:uncharacterized protein M896_110280 [Ordospora colligata OC4]KHN68999.1 hypothetical protein M896_110280 [Ordospora colligata OC4]TBU14227.1 hypothetical protein CWI40_110280 [Ordospora colligata]TBU14274.1 hypothetical protein CWI41_110280 [Ordospora colligata]